MLNGLVVDDPLDSEKYSLLRTSHHDTKGITPAHITVVKELAAIIGVDPVETPLKLSNHTSIRCIDNVCNSDSCAHDSRCAFSFRYSDFGQSLIVLIFSTGDIFIYEIEEKWKLHS